MQKWEFRVLNGVAADVEEKLNALGAEGWEIAFGSIDTVLHSGLVVPMLRAVMKREVSADDAS